ncbi:hypothetical protein IU431_06695 [Nocardia otitidiscaviarum]|uniref:hypothetical protein n=1 Tax=Nocardia otitidiscaviarum TaxID=1823 RepID=UPI0004A73EA8|nr:hypothetical protein [Nocardia otitidiscaviarum]MBF6483845.1 hypothetical protein [Nocardia otitidiscaviarum]
MASFDIAAQLEDVAAQLRAAGVRASVEPRDLNPPCAWVVGRSLAHELLSGGGTLTADVYLIAPDTGIMAALAALTELLDLALTVIEPDADTSLSESVTLPGGGGPLPAYRLTVNLETC